MSEIAVGMTASPGVVLTLLTHLNSGKVDDAIALFAEEFKFHDYGIGLEFKDKQRLAEFFHADITEPGDIEKDRGIHGSLPTVPTHRYRFDR